MFKKITFALFIGILGTIFYAQFDSWTHKKLLSLCQKMAAQSLGGSVSFSIESLNFFSPSVVLTDVTMLSIQPDAWSWRAKKCEVSCSWLQLLLHGSMDMHIIMDHCECSSHMNGKTFSIEPHFLAMMQKSLMPITTEFKSLILKNAQLFINNPDKKITTALSFNSSSLKSGNLVKTSMSIFDGAVTHHNTSYIESINTNVALSTHYKGDDLMIGLHVGGTFQLPHMGNQSLSYITGSWEHDHGRFSLRNAHNSLTVDPIIITPKEARINARMPLSYLVQCASNNSIQNRTINGIAHCAVHIGMDESNRVDGQLVIEDASIEGQHICDAGKILFARYGQDWKAKIGFKRYNQECGGVWHWHEDTTKGRLEIHNKTALSVSIAPYWNIKQNDLTCQLISDGYDIVGTYKTTITNKFTNAHHCCAGSVSYKKGTVTTNSLLDDNEISAQAQIYPTIELDHCIYKNKDKKTLINIQTEHNTKNIEGSLDFSCARSLINALFHYDLQGEGALLLKAHAEPDTFVADIKLDEATIRLPQTYNFIDGLKARIEYNTKKQTLTCNDIAISLHTGSISCLSATTIFDNNHTVTFAHAPFILDRCLINIKKDLFAIVSGNILFSHKISNTPTVSGHIFIDRAQLKENLFSETLQKQLFGYTNSLFSLPNISVGCDLIVETKSPIKVDTAFLQTNAHVNLHIQKNISSPAVSGNITLHGGSLIFPYKPLIINKGTITFCPEQLFDPTIELIASNKIKKYDVSLQVAGSLLTHHIMLDSTPPLSEEQIVALLLVGSEESSLNSMMPALIVQNLKSLIFSNNQSKFLEKYFKPLLRSFNINLVPSFSDQTGRGGLRGAIEITVDDRLKATIQKNFSLTEDTRFELEFLLSDDITLRGIRDERRDLGGEVEMRWKF